MRRPAPIEADVTQPLIRFTDRMGNKWSWVFGILTTAAFVIGIVFFAVTQTLTARDWAALVIGALIGGTIAGLVSTFIFHSSRRAAIIAAEARVAADAEWLIHDARVRQADFEAEAAGVDADFDARERAERLKLIRALPIRPERLRELEDEVVQIRMEIETAKGNRAECISDARFAAQHHMDGQAQQGLANARTWELEAEKLTKRLPEVEAERERIAGMTDEDYLEEQVHLRGLEEPSEAPKSPVEA